MCHVAQNFSAVRSRASAWISLLVSDSSRKVPEPSRASPRLVGRSARDFKTDQNTIPYRCSLPAQRPTPSARARSSRCPIARRSEGRPRGLPASARTSSCAAGARATTAAETAAAAAAASSSSTAARRRPSRPPPDAPPPVLPPDRQPSSMPVTSGSTGSHAAVPRLGVSSSLGDGA